jgi:hypothetical protein
MEVAEDPGAYQPSGSRFVRDLFLPEWGFCMTMLYKFFFRLEKVPRGQTDR